MTLNISDYKRFISVALTLLFVLGVAALPLSAQVRAQTSGLLSADFNLCSLQGSGWTSVNGGNPRLEGTFSTGDAVLRLTASAGSPVTFSETAQNAPRMMHAIDDTSFTAIAKYLTVPNAKFQMQGFLLGSGNANDSTSPSRHLRIDFHHNGSALYTYVAIIDKNPARTTEPVRLVELARMNIASGISTSGPLYLKVERTKGSPDSWEFSYRIGSSGSFEAITLNANGSTYLTTYPITTSELGIFVGSTNGGDEKVTPPGFTTSVDYIAVGFTGDDPVIADEDGLTNTLTINQPAQGGTIEGAKSGDEFGCSDNEVTLNVVPQAGWSFVRWIGDIDAGKETANPLTFIMNGSRTISAELQQATVQPTVQPTQPGGTAEPGFNSQVFLPLMSR